tara:strand:+ start:448 stop:1011 length:564 start_codon:yes stop_codon:yes gene_type:complete
MANGTLKVSNIETSSGSGTITIGQSGETVTIPSGATVSGAGANAPYFYGEVASQTEITRATDTKVVGMTSNEVDSNSAFDGTTFTVPSGSAGKYYITGTLSAEYGDIGGDGEFTKVKIFKNGSSIKVSAFQNTASAVQSETTISVDLIADLSVGDTIELYAYIQDASGGNGDYFAGRTSLGGYKLIG